MPARIPSPVKWRVIMPIKPRDRAKTRLRSATGNLERHAELVRAIQSDTIAAVLETGPVVAALHIVGDTSIDVRDPRVLLCPDPGTGLNGALASVASDIWARWPGDGVIAMVADLPALRPDELAAVLLAASAVERGIVADQEGSGTTMLTASPGHELRPQFGAGSAARHLLGGAVALQGGPGARCDVDTAADLRRCLRLGVGEYTAQMVSHLI